MVMGCFICVNINPLNDELNPICHFLSLLGAHHILHVSRIRVNMLVHSNWGNLILQHVQERPDVKIIYVLLWEKRVILIMV